jgi:hypothetical protein
MGLLITGTVLFSKGTEMMISEKGQEGFESESKGRGIVTHSVNRFTQYKMPCVGSWDNKGCRFFTFANYGLAGSSSPDLWVSSENHSGQRPAIIRSRTFH